MDKAGVMGLAAPLSDTVTRVIGDREGDGTTCLVPDKAPLMHLGC